MRGLRSYLIPSALIVVLASVVASLVVFGSREDQGPNRWSAGAMMLTARSGACLALLNDGRVLVSGGASESCELATAQIYASGRFVTAAPMGTPRSGHSCVVLDDGSVLVLA